MSFILDALKKSESERQRQSGPALFEVRVPPPKARIPLWAVLLVVLLVANAALVIWLSLRPSPSPPAVAQAASSPPAVTQRPAADPAPPPAAYPPLQVREIQAREIAPRQVELMPRQAAPLSAANLTYRRPYERPAAEPPVLAADDAAIAEMEPFNPDDYAPAVPPPAARTVASASVANLPTYEQTALASDANVPPLRLDLHVYSENPNDRFVMINMQRLREGDSLPQGPRVEAIVDDGVVMSFRGKRFLLTRH